jgi:hypothetical protein
MEDGELAKWIEEYQHTKKGEIEKADATIRKLK